MNPPVDTACFQLGAPPGYDDPTEKAEEVAQLRELQGRVRAFITAFDWAPPISDVLLAFGVGGVIGLFLVRFERPVPGSADNEREVWIVVGDLPTIFFAVEARTPTEALDLYCAIAEGWADTVLAGGDLSDCFPIPVAPTREHAEMLKDRLDFVREKFVPLAGDPERISKAPL